MWRIERHGGNSNHNWRIVFEGKKEDAECKYLKEYEKLKQGEIRLYDDENKVIKSDWAPRLRVNW